MATSSTIASSECAHAMAHELGHLLLPYGHSATGLMRANWDEADRRRAVRRQMNCTPEQAESIRARLLTLPVSQSPRNQGSLVKCSLPTIH